MFLLRHTCSQLGSAPNLSGIIHQLSDTANGDLHRFASPSASSLASPETCNGREIFRRQLPLLNAWNVWVHSTRAETVWMGLIRH
jgi:hypothetical protein